MQAEHWNTKSVPQNEYGYSDGASLLYTDGLGPCIGFCIAWRYHAWILHSACICDDEHDQVWPMFREAKKIIPERLIASVSPIVCGGDLCLSESSPDEADEFAENVLECRQRILDLLAEAGFGPPLVRWNNDGETSSLVANLMEKVVTIEFGPDSLSYQIST